MRSVTYVDNSSLIVNKFIASGYLAKRVSRIIFLFLPIREKE